VILFIHLPRLSVRSTDKPAPHSALLN
jgi:hypothetical protein